MDDKTLKLAGFAKKIVSREEREDGVGAVAGENWVKNNVWYTRQEAEAEVSAPGFVFPTAPAAPALADDKTFEFLKFTMRWSKTRRCVDVIDAGAVRWQITVSEDATRVVAYNKKDQRITLPPVWEAEIRKQVII